MEHVPTIIENYLPFFKEYPSESILLLSILFNFLLSLSFMTYFFKVSMSTSNSIKKLVKVINESELDNDAFIRLVHDFMKRFNIFIGNIINTLSEIKGESSKNDYINTQSLKEIKGTISRLERVIIIMSQKPCLKDIIKDTDEINGKKEGEVNVERKEN